MRFTLWQRRALLAVAMGLTVLAVIYAGPARDVVQPKAPAVASRPAETATQPAASARTEAETATSRDLDMERAQRRLKPPQRGPIQDAFVPRTWAVPQPAPTPVVQAPVSIAPSAPVPPPLPFEYLGQMSEDGKTMVFLNRGETPLVGRIGETLEGSYRIERIADNAVEFTYLPLNARQVLSIGGLQ